MNRYLICILTLFFIGYFQPIDLLAQKKVKGIPEALEQPKDVFDNIEAVKKYLYNNTENKNRAKPWIVISDRDNNPVYSNPDLNSEKVKDLQFKDLYYVVEDQKDWVKIATANGLNKLKSKEITPIGWMPKENLLLWNNGLVDAKTNINRKAFLLNRADDLNNVIRLKQNIKELYVDFYRNPKATVKGKERTIYDYYFVFKKENNMYLLAEEAQLTAYNVESKLIGWVTERRLQNWNTRISLEPNFSPDAYNERKANRQLEYKAFGDRNNVRDFVLNGKEEGIFWDSDPIKFPSEEMASNHRRFRRNVVRFPMFKKNTIDGVDYFRSGVIGSINVLNDVDGQLKIDATKIPEQKMAEIREIVTDLERKNNRINLFFIMEGTDKTYAFKNDVIKALKSVTRNQNIQKAANVKYGALIYRDIPEGSRIVEYERLTPDLNTVTNFITQADFSNHIDQDDFTSFYYGLKQGLKVAGFEKDAINLIILIGSCGDYSVDGIRKKDAQSKNHESLVLDKSGIFKSLSEIDAHLYSIQVYNDGRRYTGTAYAIQSQRLILESAKYIYNKNHNSSQTSKLLAHVRDLRYVEPTMAQPIGVTQVKMSGSKPGSLILPENGQSLTGSSLISGFQEMLSESLKYELTIKSVFAKAYNEGKELDVRTFSEDGGIRVTDLSSGIVQILEKKMKESRIGDDIILKSTGLKLSVYTEVFLPTKLNGAKHPLNSFVLFMPESDLLQYQDQIQRCITTASTEPYPEKRKSLFKMYMALIEQFAGQDYLKNKKPEDFTREQVIAIMQGIQDEGLDLNLDLNVRIGGIRSEREVSNKELDKLIQRFNDVNEELEKIIKLGVQYEYCMKSDESNRYYWLTLDQVF